MTFLYGTNMEMLYSLPAISSTTSTTAATIINTAATVVPYQLPAFQNIWSPSNMVGKALMFCFAGGYNVNATAESVKLQLLFDVTFPTSAASSIVIAAHGLSTVPTTPAGQWQAQCWMSCVSASGTSATWYVNGEAMWGVGNTEAGQTPGSAATTNLMWSGPAVTTGVPAVVTTSVVTPYSPDLWANCLGTSGYTITTTQMMVFGLN